MFAFLYGREANLTCSLLLFVSLYMHYNIQGQESMAHSDQPLKDGNVHISAPHIYGSAMEALDLHPNSSTSFLNIGSGTGYISCIAAQILGPNSLNYSAYRIVLYVLL